MSSGKPQQPHGPFPSSIPSYRPVLEVPLQPDVPTYPIPDDTQTASDVREALVPITRAMEALQAWGGLVTEAIRRLEDAGQASIDRAITIGQIPFTVKLEGRRHFAIMSAATPAPTIHVLIPGLPSFDTTLPLGWTNLDLPEGTILTASADALVIVRIAMDRQGVAM